MKPTHIVFLSLLVCLFSSFSKDKVTIVHWTETTFKKSLRERQFDTSVAIYKAIINKSGFYLIRNTYDSYIDTIVDGEDTIYVETPKLVPDTTFEGNLVVSRTSAYFDNKGNTQTIYSFKKGDTTEVIDTHDDTSDVSPPFPFVNGTRSYTGKDTTCAVNGKKRSCMVYNVDYEGPNDGHIQSFTSIELVDKEYLLPIYVTTAYYTNCLGCFTVQSTLVCDSIVVR